MAVQENVGQQFLEIVIINIYAFLFLVLTSFGLGYCFLTLLYTFITVMAH